MSLKTEEAADPKLNIFWREVVLPDEAPATHLPTEGGCVVRMKKYKRPSKEQILV
jgi:hypothetical protein